MSVTQKKKDCSYRWLKMFPGHQSKAKECWKFKFVVNNFQASLHENNHVPNLFTKIYFQNDSTRSCEKVSFYKVCSIEKVFNKLLPMKFSLRTWGFSIEKISTIASTLKLHQKLLRFIFTLNHQHKNFFIAC